ncbi:hypothetical protein AMS68_002004 [Peltaster fructicola]|uniref:MI domain-containing protein n=1 Tax=Peltaster fructicola TaxID=286661 RepID=A0A6H0XP00_9PEZI|nr:hypothetical protein AMS68_002004 [Peltaster fructicola]
MGRPGHTGPKIPSILLDKLNGAGPSAKGSRKDVSRKDRRKAERQQKKTTHHSKPELASRKKDATLKPIKQKTPSAASQKPSDLPRKTLKSILKRPATLDTSSDESEKIAAPRISRAVQQRLDEDDAEIAALEKKLGIKSKKSTALKEDGLDWLANGSDSEESAPGKRKRAEDDDWLITKRRKAAAADEVVESAHSESEEDEEAEDIHEANQENDPDSDMDGLENPFSDDELSDFDASDDEAPPVKKKRENPYVAPMPNTAKYIPPSLRRPAPEDLTQLKRQVQGQLNRLSEANFLSILSAIEDMYTNNARQHVTSTLIELFMGLITSPSTLNETFLILHSAFATAVYKVVGADFGAQLLERITEAVKVSSEGKQVLNLLAFLANLYIMQLVGPTIVFDYIRTLLAELSEDNTELLLRIVRTAGVQLRQDDPTALKDIVLLLTRSVAQVGEGNLSVRTKFMIETINDLKNNKMKTGSVEHVVRMKKTIGTLNTRSLRATEPLQVSLSDLEDVEKRGKWWLVGASWHDAAKPVQSKIDDGYESETPGHVNLAKLARSQGMNTDIRRAIFIAIMSASDFKDAHVRIVKLHLKSKQTLEVAKVLLHCVGGESVYNPYYTFIARKLCSEPKLQKALQSSLWDILRKITSDAEDQLSTTAVVNTARLYGTLIADDHISIAALKTLEFAMMPALAQTFAEVLLTTVLLRVSKKDFEQNVQVVFGQASSGMVQGLQFFLRDVVAQAEITNSDQEKRAVQRGCEIAIEELSHATSAVLSSDSEDESSD